MTTNTLPKDGNIDIPSDFSKYYPSELEAKRIKKPLICYLIDVNKDNKTKPTLVTKPIKVKYGSKWFNSGEHRYFINYSQIMNFGKHYAYLCQFGNAVGALSFYEYPEFAESNQVELMVNQHAVEVFKKHKGISPKLVLVIAIIACIAVIGVVITSNIAMAQNGQINTLKTQVDTLKKTNAELTATNEQLNIQLSQFRGDNE